LIAVCDADPSKVNSIPQSVIFIEDYRELQSKAQIDVVVISVPNSLHYEIAKFFLDSGIDVLLEKPATLSIKEFDDLQSIAQKNNLVFVIAFHAAFAIDLINFINLNEKLTSELKLENILGFQCNFFDPYISDEGLLPEAIGLDCSWIDSGINALSVLGKIPWITNLKVDESLATTIPHYKCRDIQSTVTFNFNSINSNILSRGVINTNWGLNINYKETKLFFNNDVQIILNHTHQKILLKRGNTNPSVIFESTNGNMRLLNHYLGVFNDFYQHFMRHTNNLENSRQLHELLFAPEKLNNIPTLYN